MLMHRLVMPAEQRKPEMADAAEQRCNAATARAAADKSVLRSPICCMAASSSKS